MGAADGAIFTRQRVRLSGFDISYLTGGTMARPDARSSALHGMGGAGKWEAYHMAWAPLPSPMCPSFRAGRRAAPGGYRLGAGLCGARGGVP